MDVNSVKNGAMKSVAPMKDKKHTNEITGYGFALPELLNMKYKVHVYPCVKNLICLFQKQFFIFIFRN